MVTMRQWLFDQGLATAPTGAGRFSVAQREAIQSAMASGMTFETPTAAALNTPRSVVTSVITAEYDSAKVRKWAKENGLSVGIRGRIAPHILDAYVRANGALPLPEQVERKRIPSTVKAMRDGKEVTIEYYREEVRQFAKENGLDVADRGRLHLSVVAAWVADRGLGVIDLPEEEPEPAPEFEEPEASITGESVTPVVRDGFTFAKPVGSDTIHREENVAFTVDNGAVIALQYCGKCRKGIRYCRCDNGPRVPKWIDQSLPVALLSRPEV